MINRYFPFLFLLILLSCQSQPKENAPIEAPQEKELMVYGDIDTAKVITQLAITESMSRTDLISETVPKLSEHLDTLELTYYFGFCDCQRWIISAIHKKALSVDPDLDKSDPRGQVQFNHDEHGYYIEAATKELAINWRPQVNGTTIQFIGREYTDRRLPADGEFTDPNPPKGKVFRYYSYKILRPYQAWGPKKFTGIDKETGDTLSEPTIITFKM